MSNTMSRNAAVAGDVAGEARAETIAGLSRLLADTYALSLKTQNFHWNVTGPLFASLHLMFEQQYTELTAAVDGIAERIRALGAPAPGSMAAYRELASIADAEGVPAAEDMVRQLIEGQEAAIRTARGVLASTEAAGDPVTADLATRRLDVHEKNAWMLASVLA